jgi:arsenite methyltransferase
MDQAMTADAAFWDRIAEKYAARPVPDVPAYERKLVIAKARFGRDYDVLDVGCGTGSLALELAPGVRHVHAIDVSGEMLRIAQRKATAAGVENVTFHRATLDDTSGLRAHRFDAVCAFNILHLVKDRDAALAKMFELLRPGGVFVSSTLCLGVSFVPYGLFLPVMRWFGKAPAVYILDREDLMHEIRDAGFDDLETPDVGADEKIAFVVAVKPR